MTAPRFNRIAGAAVIGLSTMFLTLGTAAAQEGAPPTTSEAAAGAQSSCEVVDADVDAGTATFTIGPDGCSPDVGPISFSTYELPSGQILPYEEQVLIAHAEGNGSFYGAGTYTLTASLGAALNWQADLYVGESNDVPPNQDMIAADARTGVVAAPPTTAPPTTAPATTAPDTTAPIQVASLSPTVFVAAPEVSVEAPAVTLVATVNANVVAAPAQAAQTPTTTTTTTTPTETLPATGSSSAPALVGAGGALTVLGWGIRRLTRRPAGLSH